MPHSGHEKVVSEVKKYIKRRIYVATEVIKREGDALLAVFDLVHASQALLDSEFRHWTRVIRYLRHEILGVARTAADLGKLLKTKEVRAEERRLLKVKAHLEDWIEQLSTNARQQ